MVSQRDEQRYLDYWHPKYWFTWMGLAFALAILQLPFRIQLASGRLLGTLAYYLAGHRRHITRVNIQLCFPELAANEQGELVKKVFKSAGEGIVETANAWLGDIEKLRPRFSVKGLDHFEEAMQSGRGVILLGMHFATLDLSGAVLAACIRFDVMYRRNKNQLLDLIMKRGREKHFPEAINRSDTRSVLRSLRNGHAVWYGADQDYGRKHSVFAPFFGVSAASITATSRFARMSNAQVLLFQHYRVDDGSHYSIELSKPIENFPTDDPLADATLINQLVEKAVRKHPEQYWWLHRRFKTRPQGESRPY